MNNKIIIFFILSFNFLYSAPAIIFLKGASRSGKSCISYELNKHNNWKSISSLYITFFLEELKKYFSNEYELIKAAIEKENIRHAITRNIFLFKENAKDKNQVLNAINKIQDFFNIKNNYLTHMENFKAYTINQILKNITHKNILADTSWYATKEDIKSLNKKIDVYSILVYCPFDVIIDRLINQNKMCLKAKDISNYRFFVEPIKSFMALYEFKSSSENAIDKIQKECLLNCLDKIKVCLENSRAAKENNVDNSGFMMLEITIHEFDDFCNSLIEKFKKNDVLYIVPKNKFDIVINSSKFSVGNIVNQITDFIKIKNEN